MIIMIDKKIIELEPMVASLDLVAMSTSKEGALVFVYIVILILMIDVEKITEID